MSIVTSLFSKHKDTKYDRSDNYRSKYLKKHKGVLGFYTCAYCGRIISKKNMQVDHIFPVGMAKNTFSGKLYVFLNSTLHPTQSSQGVNGTWNTCSACHTCNGKKSDAGGFWCVRGYLGKFIFPLMNIVLIGGVLAGSVMTLTGATQVLVYSLAVTLIVKVLLSLVRKFQPDKRHWRGH